MAVEYLTELPMYVVNWINNAVTAYLTAMNEVLANTIDTIHTATALPRFTKDLVDFDGVLPYPSSLLHQAATAVFGLFGLTVALFVVCCTVESLRWICCGRRTKSNFRSVAEGRGNEATAVWNDGVMGMLESSRWLRQAQNDLASAKNDLNGVSPAPEWACYKCYQAMEKLVKAFLIARNLPISMGSQELIHLASLTRDNQLRNISHEIQEKVGSISRMHSLDSIPSPSLPRDVYSRTNALRVYELTEGALEYICCLLDIALQ